MCNWNVQYLHHTNMHWFAQIHMMPVRNNYNCLFISYTIWSNSNSWSWWQSVYREHCHSNIPGQRVWWVQVNLNEIMQTRHIFFHYILGNGGFEQCLFFYRCHVRMKICSNHSEFGQPITKRGYLPQGMPRSGHRLNMQQGRIEKIVDLGSQIDPC